ncbi:MAG: hypothetical protein ABW187_07035 [Dokdonella sp.]
MTGQILLIADLGVDRAVARAQRERPLEISQCEILLPLRRVCLRRADVDVRCERRIAE